MAPSDAPAELLESYSFSRELGFSHAEFFRSLPAAIAHREYVVCGNMLRLDYEQGRVEIELGPEQVRAIASLRIPNTKVTFTFYKLSQSQREQFMQRFNLYFQRGGG